MRPHSSAPALDPSQLPLRKKEWLWVASLTAAIVLITSLPYLWAYTIRDSHVFAGFLINFTDGNTYLAKMRQGWNGSWLATLPYTAQPGAGAFLFTYYLFLGHVARWTGLSLELVYHLARVLNSVIFLLVAYRFIAHFFDSFRQRLAVWLLFALSSGLGWLATLVGLFAADLWIPELIPFFSIFAFAHFPLVWALTLWLFELTLPGLAEWMPLWPRMGCIALAVTLLAQVGPMMLLTVGIILVALLGWHTLSERRINLANAFSLGAVVSFSLPWMIYDVWLTTTDPFFAGWNAQNVTLSPSVPNMLVAGGVPLMLAGLGGVRAARRLTRLDLALLFWAILNMLLLYAPFSLQRRLTLGLWMPIVILAGQGFRDVIWPRVAVRWRPVILAGLVVSILGSNVLIYVSSLAAIQKRDPQIFMTRAEAEAFNWMAEMIPAGKIVLAAPVTAVRIPARTNARVIYGHVYETVNADLHRQAVTDFFAGAIAPEQFFTRYPVDYIFYGPHEKALGPLPQLGNGWKPIFAQANVTVYGR